MKIASVVPTPPKNPNCMLSFNIIFSTFHSNTLSKTFIVCSSSHMSMHHPFLSFETFTIQLLPLSSDNFTIPHHSITEISHPQCSSFTVGPADLPHLISSIAKPTSNTEIFSLGPHTGLELVKLFLSQTNSSFDILSYHALQTSISLSSSTTIFQPSCSLLSQHLCFYSQLLGYPKHISLLIPNLHKTSSSRHRLMIFLFQPNMTFFFISFSNLFRWEW